LQLTKSRYKSPTTVDKEPLYRSLRTTSTTIKGMKTTRGIGKKSRRNGTLFGFSVSTEIKILMGITA
ncbi:hypothetical protein ACQSDQ_06650, partial [Streptococcus infantarius]